MSSDSTPLIESQGSLTRIPLGSTFLHGTLISHELFLRITEAREADQKILILYNRRGSGRAWICQDCGYFPLCPQCDIALAYHTSPRSELVCHHCGHREGTFASCPKCQGSHFRAIGTGIQEIVRELERLFPDASTLRLDSDSGIEKSQIAKHIPDVDIIIGTNNHIALIEREDILYGVFILFESDLTLPDYRMEEEVYHTLSYAKKSGKDIFIQTYTPDHPLLELIMEGNYRDFLTKMSEERKNFHYPPYMEFVQIRIHDPHKERAEDMLHKLVNKILIMKTEDVFVSYDTKLSERQRGEWVQKIILKGKNLSALLLSIEVELVRNRSVNLEWR